MNNEEMKDEENLENSDTSNKDKVETSKEGKKPVRRGRKPKEVKDSSSEVQTEVQTSQEEKQVNINNKTEEVEDNKTKDAVYEEYLKKEEPVFTPPIDEKRPKERKSNRGLLYLLVFFLGIALTIGGIYIFKDELFQGSSSGNGICYTACENRVTINENGISDSVDKIYDAVVLVQNYVNEQLYSTGTGFVYKVDSKYGYLLTNYHVIKNNDSIRLVMSDDTVVDATYLGGDQYMDIAVLRIDKQYVKKVAEIGSSSDMKLGDTVFTVGTPVDYQFRGTVTRGILSGKDRLVTVSLDDNNNYVMKVLQTDAAINPGNSGGPLVNSNGEVIGINSSKLVTTEIEGMGFAIPIDDIVDKLETFEKGEEIERPLLGISMVNATETYTLYRLGIMLDEDITSGVVVVAVQSGSSADGVFEKGDVITKVDGVEVKSDAYLKYELFKHEVGDTITITFRRGKDERSVQVTLKES